MKQKKSVLSLLLLAGLVCCGLFLPARAEVLKEDLSAWQTVTLDVPLTKRVHLNTLTQMREADDLRKADRFLQYAGLDYDLDEAKHWSVGAGYAWTPYWKNGDFKNEQRAYERIMYRHALRKGQFMARNQLEQRFIEVAASPATWNRTLVQYSHPVPCLKGVNGVVFDELLVQLYSVKNGPQGGFNQNRVFVGFTKDLNPTVQLQAGYMNLLQKTNGTAPVTMSHIIMTQVNLRPHLPMLHPHEPGQHGHFLHHS